MRASIGNVCCTAAETAGAAAAVAGSVEEAGDRC